MARVGLQVGPMGFQVFYSDSAEGSAIRVSGTLTARGLRQKVNILVEALCYKPECRGFDSL
jgi:hypothetical protein